jgi:RNA polymerase sigma-54 factor
MRQTLSQKQTTSLSPQQIQLMKLLQIPTSVIDQRIKEELEVNPALEEADETHQEDYNTQDSDYESDGEKEFDDFGNDAPELQDSYDDFDYLDPYMGSDDGPAYNYNSEYEVDEEQKTIPIPVEDSFHEFLEQQLGLLNLEDERMAKVALQIVGSIDEDGYLRRETIAIVDDLIFSQNIITSLEEVESLLARIQRFDPPGIGARNLQECLYLQLLHKLETATPEHNDMQALHNAVRIVQEFFEEFSKKHFPRLQRQLSINEKQLKAAIDTILKLNPKPASGHVSSSDSSSNYIVPDFTVMNREGTLDMFLNSRNEPELRISDHYKDMIRDYRVSKEHQKVSRTQKEAITFVKQKIDSAKWFIDAIKQRNETMLSTMYAIMQYQSQYFLTGDEKRLKPMILKDIAEMTKLDISTVSRVANSKYVQTEFGTKRLKDFFSESLQTDDGDEVSTLEVKKILSDIIGEESKRKPHSDEKLKILLQKKGYNIARRTVAKYREQLNIPVARLRKAL